MGRLSSLFDTKRNEENRKLINGYLEEKAKRESLPKIEYRANTEPFNTAPSSYSPVKVEMANPVPSNDVSLAKKYSAGPKLNSEAMNNLKKYQSENATSNATFKAGVPEDFKPIEKDAYEDTQEYQYLNRLSQKPIVGKLAPVVGMGQYVLSSTGSGVEGLKNIALQAVSKEKIDSHDVANAYLANATREGYLRALRNNLGMKYDGDTNTGEKVANFLGGVVGDSLSSSARRLVLGPGGLALAAGSAANQEFLEDLANPNITRNQMLASAITHGAIEAGTEAIPTAKFLELSKNGLGTTGKEIAKNIFKQMGQEGFEEFISDILNDASDVLIKGKESDVIKEYLARKENGESGTSAMLNTGVSRLGNAGMSGLAGALSGGMSAGIAGTTHTFSQGMRYNDVNNFKEIAESADTTTEEGKAIHEVANRLAEKEAKGQRITDFDRGYLSNAVENAAIEDYNRQQEELKGKDKLKESKDNEQESADNLQKSKDNQ